MIDFIKAITLLFVLLNPFLLIIYLVDVVQKLDQKKFQRAMLRAGMISSITFCCFAVLGDAVFSNLIQAEFASFQIFGGVIFLLIGIQFVFQGPSAITILRGESEHLSGAIAMPIMIGPGTISASIVIGNNLHSLYACIGIILAVASSVLVMLLLKAIHDFVRPRREPLIQKYTEIAGRVTALFVGTISIEMIMRGIGTWLNKFQI